MATLICGNSEIIIIQGDSFQMTVTVEGLSAEVIDSVLFSCEKLNLCKELTITEDGAYLLSFESSETKSWETITATYDLTVRFSDSKIKTVIHNSSFKVIEKTNKVGCYE